MVGFSGADRSKRACLRRFFGLLVGSMLLATGMAAGATPDCVGSPSSFLRDLAQALRTTSPALDPQRNPPTFGIEIEGSVLRSFGREGVAKKIAEVLRRSVQGEIHVESVGFDTTEIYYREGSLASRRNVIWQVKKDGSIRPRGMNIGVEVVSPILTSEADRRIFFEVLRELRASGFVEEPMSSGIHIHVGAMIPTSPYGSHSRRIAATTFEAVLLARIFSWMEDSLVRDLHQVESRAYYSRPLPNSVRDELSVAIRRWLHFPELRIPLTKDLIYRIRPTGRYYNFNFDAIDHHGTLEIRLFNSSTQPELVENYLLIVSELVRAVRSRDPRLIAYLESYSSGDPARGVLAAIGIDESRLLQMTGAARDEAQVGQVLHEDDSRFFLLRDRLASTFPSRSPAEISRRVSFLRSLLGPLQPGRRLYLHEVWGQLQIEYRRISDDGFIVVQATPIRLSAGPTGVSEQVIGPSRTLEIQLPEELLRQAVKMALNPIRVFVAGSDLTVHHDSSGVRGFSVGGRHFAWGNRVEFNDIQGHGRNGRISLLAIEPENRGLLVAVSEEAGSSYYFLAAQELATLRAVNAP